MKITTLEDPCQCLCHQGLAPCKFPCCDGKNVVTAQVGIFADLSLYAFPNNPVVMSSTSVLKASVCQQCGCKLDGKPLTKICDCKCHKEGAR